MGREKEMEMEMEEMEELEEMEEMVEMEEVVEMEMEMEEMEEMVEMEEMEEMEEMVRLHITPKKKEKEKDAKAKKMLQDKNNGTESGKSLIPGPQKKITLPNPQTSRTSNKKPLALFPQTRKPQMTERRRQPETTQPGMIF